MWNNPVVINSDEEDDDRNRYSIAADTATRSRVTANQRPRRHRGASSNVNIAPGKGDKDKNDIDHDDNDDDDDDDDDDETLSFVSTNENPEPSTILSSFYRNPSEILDSGRQRQRRKQRELDLDEEGDTIYIATPKNANYAPLGSSKMGNKQSTLDNWTTTGTLKQPTVSTESSLKSANAPTESSISAVNKNSQPINNTSLKSPPRNPNNNNNISLSSPIILSSHRTPKSSKIFEKTQTESPSVIPSKFPPIDKSPIPTSIPFKLKHEPTSSDGSMGSLENQLERTGLVTFANRTVSGLGPLYRHDGSTTSHKFAVEVITPTTEEAAEYLINKSEFEIVKLLSRTTASNGQAHYSILYGDGHIREVHPSEVLNYISIEALEKFENECFEKNENMETDYYAKHEGGVSTGGTFALKERKAGRGFRYHGGVRVVELDGDTRRRRRPELHIPLIDESDPDDDSYKPMRSFGQGKRPRGRPGRPSGSGRPAGRPGRGRPGRPGRVGRPPAIKFQTSFSDSEMEDVDSFDTSPYMSDSMMVMDDSDGQSRSHEVNIPSKSNTYLAPDGTLKKKRGRPFGARTVHNSDSGSRKRKDDPSPGEVNSIAGKKRGPGRPPGFTPKRQRRSESPAKMPLEFPVISPVKVSVTERFVRAESPEQDMLYSDFEDNQVMTSYTPNEEEYDVEMILDSMELDGVKLYLVKWLHYDNEHDNTWEPADRLENASSAIEEYERKQRAGPSNKNRLYPQKMPVVGVL